MKVINICRHALASALILVSLEAAAQSSMLKTTTPRADVKGETLVIFLGTGFPRPDPHAMGPALAIVVNGRAYVVDAGAGAVRRAAEAFEHGETALAVDNLDIVFLTHLHSDHTIGLPDLLFTPWIVGRTKPLTVIGPKGSKNMLNGIAHAWAEDIHVRLEGGEGGNPTGYKTDVQEIVPGKVYQDANVTVTAFRVSHGSWHDSFGYRFDTPDKSIVISGDTAANPEIIGQYCNGCDMLIHEAFTGGGIIENTFAKKKYGHSQANWAGYMSKFHTSARDLGLVAKAARPKRLIVHHTILLGNATDQDVVRDIRLNFNGQVDVAKDLQKF